MKNLIFSLLLAVSLGFGIFCIAIQSKRPEETEETKHIAVTSDTVEHTTVETEPPVIDLYARPTLATLDFGDSIISENAILIDMESKQILAEKNSTERIYPASLTKIMTVIVAIENTRDMLEIYTMPDDIYEYLYISEASVAGFQPNEQVRIIDLLYGAILPSGADATIGLARCLFGSEENMVAEMNAKLKELGLENTTHFTNTSGLHDDMHYSTAADMAVIFEYALKNPIFRQIIQISVYKTAPTEMHPEGLDMWSTFLCRLSEDSVPGVSILGGKTGYTSQAGSCLASFASKDSSEYMLITLNASVEAGYKYPNIEDAITIYTKYLG